MHVDPETTQTTNTTPTKEPPVSPAGNVVDGQARKNRQFFHLALLITTALLTTAFWVSNTQTPATTNLDPTAPTAPYCPPPNNSDPQGSSAGSDPQGSSAGSTGSFNKRDRDAIRNYTAKDPRPMNDALRRGEQAGINRHIDTINALNNALRKLPDYKGIVYRSARLSEQIIESYSPGKVITEKAFTSTSRDSELKGYGSVKFEIESKTGKNIWKYSKFKEDHEVLFMSGTRFIVQSKYENDEGEWVIEMSEVD